jgi:hypothetical protein
LAEWNFGKLQIFLFGLEIWFFLFYFASIEVPTILLPIIIYQQRISLILPHFPRSPIKTKKKSVTKKQETKTQQPSLNTLDISNFLKLLI